MPDIVALSDTKTDLRNVNRELIILNIDFEGRVEKRPSELQRAKNRLKKYNTELLELHIRV